MKRPLLFFTVFTFIFFFTFYAFAQQTAAPSIEWKKALGGNFKDYCRNIQQTTDGGYVVAGWSGSNTYDVTGNHGLDDFWIVKLTSIGVIEWQKSLGGSSMDNAQSIQQVADGGYIVAGSSLSNDNDVSGHHGSQSKEDSWIVKLTNVGSIEWQRSIGGSNSDRAVSIIQTTDGGYITAGSTHSTDGDVKGRSAGSTESDYWIVKLTNTGSVQWERSLGGSRDDFASSIDQTSDGGYIVAGTSFSEDGDVIGRNRTKDTCDYWVVKLSSIGDIEWQRSLGGNNGDGGHCIQQTTDGGYIIAGGSNSIDGDITENHGKTDCWIVKLTSSGEIEWQKTYGGSKDDAAYSIQQISDGGYIIAGSSGSYDGDVTGQHENMGTTNYWVIRLTGQGALQWQKSFGGRREDNASCIQQIADGGFILAGYSESNDGDVIGSHGDNDYWIIKLSPEGTSSTESETVIVNSISITPNPAKVEVRINVQSAMKEDVKLKVIDMSGKTVIELPNQMVSGNQDISVDTRSLTEGSYVIEVASASGTKQTKILIQR